MKKYNLSRISSYLFELLRGKLNSIYFNFFYKNAKIGNTFRLGNNSSITLWDDCNISIGDNVYLRNFLKIQIEGGQLKIGKNTFFNNFCSINCLYKIAIGNDCLFGEAVKIYDHNHRHQNEQLIRNQGYSFGEILIGNNCWIGSNVVILKGVQIGDNVVVGANVVVYKDIASNMIIKNDNASIIRSVQSNCHLEDKKREQHKS